MEQDKALQIIISAVYKGQKAGVYTFEESTIIYQAIQSFKKNKLEPIQEEQKEQLEKN